MNVVLTPASLNEKPILERLMELYLYDFSEFDGADVGANGVYGYPYMDQYWLEPQRSPFLIDADGRLAGFVLVCEHSWLGSSGKMIAEFFVMRKYRRQGVGKLAAFAAFDRFRGHWEVSELAQNLPAQSFWRTVIAEYTQGNYREVILDNEDWQGPIQIFENGAPVDAQTAR